MSHEDTSLTIVERGNAIAITTKADYEAAAEYLKGATALMRRIQESYGRLKQLAHLAHKGVVDEEKVQVTPVSNAIERVKGLMISWTNEQTRLAAIEQAKLQAKADKKGGAVVPQAQVVADIPKVEGLSGRDTWHAIVDDVELLPREYLLPNMPALNQAAKRMRASFNIPGAHAEPDQNVIVKGV
jgi:hypothetical protein